MVMDGDWRLLWDLGGWEVAAGPLAASPVMFQSKQLSRRIFRSDFLLQRRAAQRCTQTQLRVSRLGGGQKIKKHQFPVQKPVVLPIASPVLCSSCSVFWHFLGFGAPCRPKKKDKHERKVASRFPVMKTALLVLLPLLSIGVNSWPLKSPPFASSSQRGIVICRFGIFFSRFCFSYVVFFVLFVCW